jgi:hypothetical protein
MAENQRIMEYGGSGSPDVPIKAFRVGIEIKFDLESAEVQIESWSMNGFRMVGRDLFALMERVPAEIEKWFHKHHGMGVVVIPVYSTFDAHSRRPEEGYVAVPIRPLAAALRAMEPKP